MFRKELLVIDKEFDIQEYMTRGVERVVSDAIKATLKNPKESAFMLGFAASSAAMHSPLFMALQSGDILKDDHDGGCVLYEKRELVEQLMAG